MGGMAYRYASAGPMDWWAWDDLVLRAEDVDKAIDLALDCLKEQAGLTWYIFRPGLDGEKDEVLIAAVGDAEDMEGNIAKGVLWESMLDSMRSAYARLIQPVN